MIWPMRLLFTFVVLLYTAFAYSFEIDRVNVKCLKSSDCKDAKKVFRSLKREYKDLKNFQKILKLYVANEGIRKFEYYLYE